MEIQSHQLPLFCIHRPQNSPQFHNPKRSLSLSGWMETLSIYDCKFVYVKGEDNTMADALSCYPSLSTPSDINAQENAHHLHLGPFNNPFSILDRSNMTPTPLMSITVLTDTNPQHTKIQFSIDDDTISKLHSGYEKMPGAKNFSPLLVACQTF